MNTCANASLKNVEKYGISGNQRFTLVGDPEGVLVVLAIFF
jgi:hypothetical protein